MSNINFWFHGTTYGHDIERFEPFSHFGDLSTAKKVCSNSRYAPSRTNNWQGKAVVYKVKLDLDDSQISREDDWGSHHPNVIAGHLLRSKENYGLSDQDRVLE